jgi:predicted dehydrogenase
MKEIRWGIIGCGDVTEIKSGPGFQKAVNSRLVAVMRRNGELAKDYAQRHGVPKWYDDAQALIQDPEINAVYVATPPAYHKEYTMAAAEAGKAVYVEKPMALNFGECQEMVSFCQARRVPLYVAYYRRSLPRFRKVKELIDNKVVGDIRFVQITHYAQPSESDLVKEQQPWRVDVNMAGGGYFFDMGCHTLDLLDYYFGPIINAQGNASNQAGLYGAEDVVSGSFTFASGVHGTGIWCFSSFQNVERVLLVGSKGQIQFSCFSNEPVLVTASQGEEQLWIENPPHVQQPLIENVVGELLGQRTCPSTGVSGARTNWVMERLMERTD